MDTYPHVKIGELKINQVRELMEYVKSANIN